MAFFRRASAKEKEPEVVTTGIEAASKAVLTEGSLEFTAAQGGNGTLPSYQEASGAPVETKSPLGYFVGPVTVVFLNISMMVGTGIYSTRELPNVLAPDDDLELIFIRSRYRPQRHRLRWVDLIVLAYRFSDFDQCHDGVSGVCCLLPESIGCRSRLSRTSISTSRLLLSRGFCRSVRHIVF